MPPSDDLIASKPACDLLEIDRSTLTRWVASGRIKPAVKLPGQTGAYLFYRADVEAERKARVA